MPTRLRAIFVYAGSAVSGGQTRANLEYAYAKHGFPPLARGEMPEAKRLVKMFEKVKSTGLLFLFREPRGISHARSRYKSLCEYYGIHARVLKKTGVFRNARPLQQAAIAGRRARRPTPPLNLRNRVAPARGVLGGLGGAITRRIPLGTASLGWQFEGINANGESMFARQREPAAQAPAPGIDWASLERDRAQQEQERTVAEITQRLIQQRQAMQASWDSLIVPEREPIDNEF
jgi:hypothetical protein